MVSRSAEEFADKRADFQCWLWIVMDSYARSLRLCECTL